MFATTLSRFKIMRSPVRALLGVYWVYSFTGGLIGAFTQIFLYDQFTSVSLNIVATVIFYTGIMLGFCVPGMMAALWRLNLKHGFLWSFVAMGLALIYFLQASTVATAYLAMFLWGFGQGIFWLTINTFELSETKAEERDFYSSILNAGNQILSLVGPACAVLLIWLSGHIFHIGTFTLLFTVAPVMYLLGFLFFARIRDYRPQPIVWADVRHFFFDRRNQAAQLYTLGTGFQQILDVTIPPLLILLVLGTPLNVGVYNTFFALFSVFCVIVVAQYRTPANRLKIYGLTTLGLVLATIWFGYSFSFVALVIYTIVVGILSPHMNISSHVVDLNSMEIGRTESDFYATMILRDFFLWIWRSVGGLTFLAVITLLGTQKEILQMGMYLLATMLLLMYAGAFLLTKLQPRPN